MQRLALILACVASMGRASRVRSASVKLRSTPRHQMNGQELSETMPANATLKTLAMLFSALNSSASLTPSAWAVHRPVSALIRNVPPRARGPLMSEDSSSVAAPPEFWPINEDFPGVKALHRDPDVFVVEDLLSEEHCEALINTATPFLAQSKMFNPEKPELGYTVDPRRSSFDVRLDFEDETVRALQQRFSEVLNMPVSHFEPLKVSRYNDGQQFAAHHDSSNDTAPDGIRFCPTPYCNRLITLFVYLRDCATGGATAFYNLGFRIQPKRGMGVIHFPARMPSGKGLQDARVIHAGEPAIAGHEKFICQQWGWSGPTNRAAIPEPFKITQDGRLVKLRAELEKLPPSKLRKRAVAACVDEAEIEAAEDSKAPKLAMMQLILSAARTSQVHSQTHPGQVQKAGAAMPQKKGKQKTQQAASKGFR